MKLCRVRLTIRRLLVVIAVAAIASNLEAWRRKIPYCQAQAVRCEGIGRAHLELAESHGKLSALYRDKLDVNQATIYKVAIWTEQGKAKGAAERGRAFRRAARYPWCRVPPVWEDQMGPIPEPEVTERK